MFQTFVMTFATLLGFAKPTIPATFHTNLPEAAIGDLRLKDGESVEVASKFEEDGVLRIEIRSRGKSLVIPVTEADANGFDRPADRELDVPVRGRLTREKTESSTPGCVAAYVFSKSAVFGSQPPCAEKKTETEATFTLEFEGVGRIETGAALISN